MSLYSVAQAEASFYLASNLDSSSTEKAAKAGLTVSSSVFGTVTQNNSSITGNYSFDFSSNGRVLHQWSGTSGSKNNLILEAVFKKSTNPTQNVTIIKTPGTTTAGDGAMIDVNSSGQIRGFVRNSSGSTCSVTSTTDFCDGNWHHVVWAYNNASGNNARLYVDGTLIGSTTTIGTIGQNGQVNIGSDLGNTGSIPAGTYLDGTVDFVAYYQPTSPLSTSAVDTFVANHMAAFADKEITATALTASALMVEPTISRDGGYAAQVATASALATDWSWNFVNYPTMLDTYMQTLSFEQWYKFDQHKKIRNYGTGGNAETAWAFNGSATTDILGGRQGSGALVFPGQQGNTVQLGFGVNQPYSTEITDNEFTIGFWFKAESGFGDKLPNIVYLQQLFSNNNYYLRIRTSGYVEWNMNGSSSNQVVHSTNVTDGNWHFITVSASNSNNIISVNVDNGTAVSTSTTGTWPTVSSYSFNQVTNSGANTKKAWMSHYWVNGYNTINGTQIGNMITYAGTPIQGASIFPEPVVKFTNSYNDYIQANGSVIEFRMDEATDTPVNFGTINTISIGKNGTNITYLQPTVNRYAYKFTNADTYLQGDWTAASGTFSTAAEQSVVIRFKSNGYKSFEQILASTGQKGFLGTGITIALGANNGHISARLNRGFGPTDTETISWNTNIADNEWHLVVASKAGSKFTLYVDGKQRAQITNSAITPADSGTWGLAAESKYNTLTSATKELYIDEFAVLATEITDAEAFEMYQAISLDTDNEISALFVNPAYSAGFGPTVSASPMLATADEGTVFPFVVPLTAQALFQNPNFEAIKNTSNAVTAWTASAQMETITFSVGEYNGAQSMEATASMGDHRAYIPGFWNANPMIANPASMVEPAFSSTRGALIKPQSLNARAFMPTPPAYKLITDDIWYTRLYDQHSEAHGEKGNTPGVSSAYAFLKLFNDVTSNLTGEVASTLTNNLPWSIVIDNPSSTSTTVTYAKANNQFLTASPSPLLETGYYDEFERKAVRFRNIQFKIDEDPYMADGAYTLEFTFKSTKANQVIAQGRKLSFTGNQKATSTIGLYNGKLYAGRVTQGIGLAEIFAHPDNIKELKDVGFANNFLYGNKSIADGLWHHIIIQHGFDGRVQFWIDGELDIQVFGDNSNGNGGRLRPYIFGSNQTNTRWQSDFETSAWSYDAAHFVPSQDITLHYTAAIKYEPIQVAPMTATADITQDNIGAGNRGRALMLYFWPTSVEQRKNLSYATFTSNESPNELGTVDYFTSPPQEYEGWDVFPVDVTGYYVSDLVKPEAYGVENIRLTTPSGSTRLWKVNQRNTFRNILTDAPRYIDLVNDIDLSKFDMIMFKNYPDDPKEKDAFSTNEVVDSYFNLRESVIFEDFVKSLRAAVDTGISLLVTNPQLALDLKIVDRVESIPDMDDLTGYESDPYAPTQVPQAANLPVTTGAPFTNHWWDTWKNNRARIVNTQAGLTDNPGLVRTQMAFWNNDDNGVKYGGPDRPFNRYEHKTALAVGDELVLSSEPNATTRKSFLAAPISAVKSGRVITAFANTVRRGLSSITNPYKDYAVSIAVNPGDVLDGRQVGGKIFVNFTENINNSIETGDVDLISDYWINYAYENGAIDADQRDAYLAAEWNTNTTPYWSSDGMNILVQVSPIQDENLSKKGTQTAPAKVRKINKQGGISFQSVASGSQYFALQYSWQYPRATFEVPSILTNGFRWLSNRETLEGTVIRPVSLDATAQMPEALAVPDKVNNYQAQAMVANGYLPETEFSSGERRIPALPMTATATIVKPGSTIGVPPMTASAVLRTGSRALVANEDQVTLYLIHVDPILYIREDVIK